MERPWLLFDENQRPCYLFCASGAGENPYSFQGRTFVIASEMLSNGKNRAAALCGGFDLCCLHRKRHRCIAIGEHPQLKGYWAGRVSKYMDHYGILTSTILAA